MVICYCHEEQREGKSPAIEVGEKCGYQAIGVQLRNSMRRAGVRRGRDEARVDGHGKRNAREGSAESRRHESTRRVYRCQFSDVVSSGGEKKRKEAATAEKETTNKSPTGVIGRALDKELVDEGKRRCRASGAFHFNFSVLAAQPVSVRASYHSTQRPVAHQSAAFVRGSQYQSPGGVSCVICTLHRCTVRS